MANVVETILNQMSTVKKPQRTFLMSLFTVLMVFHGKATFRNLSRYCEMNEKSFSRWYRQEFDFVEFNVRLLDEVLPADSPRIAAVDASFMSKSGKKTEGLGWFYNGSAGEAQRGLEISVLSVIDLKANTAWAMDARQTKDEEDTSRITGYADQVVELVPRLKAQQVRHVAADALYYKRSFIEPVTAAGLEIVGRLRNDANLKWVYTGEYQGHGRPRKYDGKVLFDEELERFDDKGKLDKQTRIYTKVVHSVSLKRQIRVVMLRRKNTDGKISKVLLYSTDTALDAKILVSYYRARFQIEFLFRDAKQHTGLTDCQSRSSDVIQAHVNASLTALNLMKAEDRRHKKTHTETVISIASWKRRKSNQNLMNRLFDDLDLDPKCQKVIRTYKRFSNYGVIDDYAA